MRLILILSLTTLSAFAAGNGGHGSVTDLIAPAINFFILFGFLAFKLKGPAREHFTNKAKNIKETIERASQKSQQAEAKMKEQKDKMNNLDNAKKEILASAENEANDFANRNKKETTERIEKMRKDADLRVQAEMSSLVHELNRELVDRVVAKAKTKIKSDNSLQGKVTEKLLKEIR